MGDTTTQQRCYTSGMQDAKEEVRSRLSIEDVIGEYVQLKRAGRNFKGLSPFSGEKTPSFVVSPEKQIWHDFSSGRGGDVFSFVMLAEGMDFRQTLEHLARKAGVDLSQYESAKSGQMAEKKRRLLEAHVVASKYYQQSMLTNHHALEYTFKRRGLNKSVVQDFMIGYAPDSGDGLTQVLLRKGFSRAEIADAGLSNRFGGDLFRGRMMIPLMDATGRVIGFTGRILSDDPKAPKYLNTPQSLLYDKSRHVFGFSQAKEAIRTSGYSVIVEGNLDVVSSHQAGVQHVVATAGTALTEHHLKALSRLAPVVRLAFDGDKAGIAATERAIPIAQSVGVELSVITLPDGYKDPDELIQHDASMWLMAVESAVPAVEWVLGQYKSHHDLTSAAGKRAYTSAGLSVVAHLSDPVERDHYLAYMATEISTPVETLREKLNQSIHPEDTPLRSVASIPAEDEILREEIHQDNLLAILLLDSSIRELVKNFDDSMLRGDARRAVLRYVQSAKKTVQDTPRRLQNYDTYVKMVLLKADARYAAWDERDRYFEAARLIRSIITEHKQQKKVLLIERLRDAETAGRDDDAQTIRQELHALIKEIEHGR